METSDSLLEYVTTRLDKWREHRDTNNMSRWDEYERLWRGMWAAEDKTRQSERSKIVTPAIQQAVESAVAEIEETVFGAAAPFDIRFDEQTVPPADAAQTKKSLIRDLHRSGMRKAVSEALLNSAVYGTGLAELVIDTRAVRKAASVPLPTGEIQQGVMEVETPTVLWRTINPRNFLIDPLSTTINDAMGVAIEEFVSRHLIEDAIAKGLYEDVDLDDTAATDPELEKDVTQTQYTMDRVKLTRYYGKVPARIFDNLAEGDEIVELFDTEDEEDEDSEEDEEYIEVIIVYANDSKILKKERNPYMMQDRPVVAFPWDRVPNRFWGRGICEKGFNAQKALDAEVRSRLDSLALTVYPMMAADATRLPRGFNLQVTPGRNILTQGNPAEILMPFKFGQLDPNSWQNFANLREMVFEATGTNETGGASPAAIGDAKSGAVSMVLSGMIKRQKRTLFSFYDEFLMPAVQKTAWRYMQFNPEEYPAQDYEFVPASMMGITAREYETSQLVALLQAIPQESPAAQGILTGIVQNSSLQNREAIIEMMQTPPQPDPQAQQRQDMMFQLEVRAKMAEIAKLEAEAGLTIARTEYEATYKPQIEMVNAMAEARPDKEGDRDFDKLVTIAELAIKEKDQASNERIAQMQMETKSHADGLSAQASVHSEMVRSLQDQVANLTKALERQMKAKRKAVRNPDGSLELQLEEVPE